LRETMACLQNINTSLGAFPKSRTFLFLALKGRQHTSPGQRPGYVAALSGLRKEMSDFLGMRPPHFLDRTII